MFAVDDRHTTAAGASPPARDAEQRDAPDEVFELISGLTGRKHLVRVADVEAVLTAESLWFPTLCGTRILAASLAAVPDTFCRDCRRTGRAWRRAGSAKGEQR